MAETAFQTLAILRLFQCASLVPLLILTALLRATLLPYSFLLYPYILSWAALVWATLGNCLFMAFAPLAAIAADAVFFGFFGGASYQLHDSTCNGGWLVVFGIDGNEAACGMPRACFGMAILETVLFFGSTVMVKACTVGGGDE